MRAEKGSMRTEAGKDYTRCCVIKKAGWQGSNGNTNEEFG